MPKKTDTIIDRWARLDVSEAVADQLLTEILEREDE